MAKELSGYGPTAGESMGEQGELNQQGGVNNSNSGSLGWWFRQCNGGGEYKVGRGGDGVSLNNRMCRLMLMIMGRCVRHYKWSGENACIWSS